MSSFPVIDYESAVSAYMDNLSTMLRGFVPAKDTEFLATWVPDEDQVRGIVGIFEAAKESGIPGVTVRVGADTQAVLSQQALRTAAAQVGPAEIATDGETLVLTMSFRSLDPFAEVDPVYAAALREEARSRRYEGKIEPEAGCLAAASDGDLLLMALIDAETHEVRKARYMGAASEPQRALLERLCPLLEGKPILECGDHAVIELEYDLRDHTQPPPVAGIVLPANSDPLFALSVRLVRGVMADYRRQTSYTGNVNFYVKPSSARWLALSQRDRQEEIAAGLRSFPGGQNFHLIRLEGDRRVILEMGDTADGGRNLLKLEHHLRRSVEPVLQLHLETKADLNTIRRIKEVKA